MGEHLSNVIHEGKRELRACQVMLGNNPTPGGYRVQRIARELVCAELK